MSNKLAEEVLAELLAESEQAHDGDTTKSGLRLKGIEAPETAKPGKPGEPLSDLATEVLNELIAESGGAIAESEGKDYYGRDLGVLRGNDGRDLNAEMAKSGVVHRPRYGKIYEDEFRAAHRNLSTDTGDLITDTATRDRMGRVKSEQDEAWLARELNPNFQRVNKGTKPWEQNTKGVMAKAMLRGMDQSQAMLYAAGHAIGQLFDVDVVEEWGLEGIERNLREAAQNPPEIQSYEDVDSLAKAGTYIIEAIGEQAPQLLVDLGMALGTGGTSVAISMAGRAAVGKFFKRQMGEVAYGKLFGRMSKAGAMAGIYGQTAGEAQLEMLDQGIEAPGTALGVGAVNSVIEYKALETILSPVFKSLKKAKVTDSPTIKSAMGDALKRSGLMMPVEGGTELLQTVTTKIAAQLQGGEDAFNEKNITEYIDAFLKGSVVGGTLGAGSSLTGSALQYTLQAKNRHDEVDQLAGQQTEEETTPVSEEPQASTGDSQPDQSSLDEYTPPAETKLNLTPSQKGESTRAEPEIDLQAQYQDLMNPEHPRQAMFVSANTKNADKAANWHKNKGGFAIKEQDGYMLFADEARTAEYLYATPQDKEQIRQEALGYAFSKTEVMESAQKGDQPVTVYEETPEGARTKEEAVPESMAEQVVAQRQQEAPADRVVGVESPEQTVERSESLVTQEPQPSESDQLLDELVDKALANKKAEAMLLFNSKGKPYAKHAIKAAQRRAEREEKATGITHDVVEYQGGWAVRPVETQLESEETQELNNEQGRRNTAEQQGQSNVTADGREAQAETPVNPEKGQLGQNAEEMARGREGTDSGSRVGSNEKNFGQDLQKTRLRVTESDADSLLETIPPEVISNAVNQFSEGNPQFSYGDGATFDLFFDLRIYKDFTDEQAAAVALDFLQRQVDELQSNRESQIQTVDSSTIEYMEGMREEEINPESTKYLFERAVSRTVTRDRKDPLEKRVVELEKLYPTHKAEIVKQGNGYTLQAINQGKPYEGYRVFKTEQQANSLITRLTDINQSDNDTFYEVVKHGDDVFTIEQFDRPDIFSAEPKTDDPRFGTRNPSLIVREAIDKAREGARIIEKTTKKLQDLFRQRHTQSSRRMKDNYPVIKVSANGANHELSNSAYREFFLKDHSDKPFYSVDHAIESLKSGKFNLQAYASFGEKVLVAEKDSKPLPVTKLKVDDALLNIIVRSSFEQNKPHRKKLIGTGYAALPKHLEVARKNIRSQNERQKRALFEVFDKTTGETEKTMLRLPDLTSAGIAIETGQDFRFKIDGYFSGFMNALARLQDAGAVLSDPDSLTDDTIFMVDGQQEYTIGKWREFHSNRSDVPKHIKLLLRSKNRMWNADIKEVMAKITPYLTSEQYKAEVEGKETEKDTVYGDFGSISDRSSGYAGESEINDLLKSENRNPFDDSDELRSGKKPRTFDEVAQESLLTDTKPTKKEGLVTDTTGWTGITKLDPQEKPKKEVPPIKGKTRSQKLLAALKKEGIDFKNTQVVIRGLEIPQQTFIKTALDSIEANMKVLALTRSEYLKIKDILPEHEVPGHEGGFHIPAHDISVIVLRDQPKKPTERQQGERFFTMAYELGHGLEKHLWASMNPKQKAIINDQYNSYKKGTDSPLTKDEWLADKVGLYLIDKSSQAKNMVDALAKRIARTLAKFYRSVAKKLQTRFSPDESVTQVMDELVASGAFRSKITVGSGRAKPFELNALSAGVRDTLRPRVTQLRKLGKDIVNGNGKPYVLYNMFRGLYTTDRQTKDWGGEVAELARMFYGDPGDTSTVTNPITEERIRGDWFKRTVQERGVWWNNLMEYKVGDRAFKDYFEAPKGMKKWLHPEARVRSDISNEVQEGILQLQRGNSQLNPFAQLVRSFLNDYHQQYLKKAMPTLGFLDNYFPIIFNQAEVQHRKDQLKEIIREHKVAQYTEQLEDWLTEEGRSASDHKVRTMITQYEDSLTKNIDGIIENIVHGGASELAVLLQDKQNIGPGFDQRHSRDFFDYEPLQKVLAEANFMEKDIAKLMFSYIASSTKRAEFERIFGGYKGHDAIYHPEDTERKLTEARERNDEEGIEKWKKARKRSVQFILDRWLYSVAGLDRQETVDKLQKLNSIRVAGNRKTAALVQNQADIDMWVDSLQPKQREAWHRLARYSEIDPVGYWGRLLKELSTRTEDNQEGHDFLRYKNNGDHPRIAEFYSPFDGLKEHLDNIADSQGSAAGQFAFNMVKSYLGQVGMDMPPDVRNAMSWMMAYQSILTLAFSTLSSFPDIAGGVLRTRKSDEMWRAQKDLRKIMAARIKKSEDWERVSEAAHSVGLVGQRVTTQVMQDLFGSTYMTDKPQKVLDTLFHWNGQEKWTEYSRITNLYVAEEAIKRWAKQAKEGDADAGRYLSELEIDHNIVSQWDGNYYSLADAKNGVDQEAREKMQRAVFKFVEESVVRPNAAQRPLWASNPWMMLIWHLKSFFYSYGKIVVAPFLAEVKRQMGSVRADNTIELYGKRVAVAALPLMFAGVLLGGLAGIGWEMRELIQYSAFGREPRTDRMSNSDYGWELASRAGIWGPFEMAGNAIWGYGDLDRRSAMLLGPTADWLLTVGKGLGTGEYDAAVFRSTPVLSQLPGLKANLRDSL